MEKKSLLYNLGYIQTHPFKKIIGQCSNPYLQSGVHPKRATHPSCYLRKWRLHEIPILLQHQLNLPIIRRRRMNEINHLLGQLGLGELIQHSNDGLCLQPHRHRGVERMRRQIVLVHRLRPADGLGDGDEEVIGLLVEGRERLQEDPAVSTSPQRAVHVVRLQLQPREIPLLHDSIIVARILIWVIAKIDFLGVDWGGSVFFLGREGLVRQGSIVEISEIERGSMQTLLENLIFLLGRDFSPGNKENRHG